VNFDPYDRILDLVSSVLYCFPYASFLDISHLKVFDEAIRVTRGDVCYALFLHTFSLAFRSF
jgi:hypothetical protein